MISSLRSLNAIVGKEKVDCYKYNERIIKMATSNFDLFPQELILNIGLQLEYHDWINLTAISKKLADLSTNSYFWLSKITALNQHRNKWNQLANLSVYQLKNFYRQISAAGSGYILPNSAPALDYLGLQKYQPLPIIHLPNDIVQVSCSGNLALSLTATKQIWETNFGGRLITTLPINNPGGESVTQVSLRYANIVYLTLSGKVYTSGPVAYQLKVRPTGNKLIPVPLPPNSRVIQISAGAHHLSYITDQGHLYVYGTPWVGKITFSPQIKVTQVSSGNNHLAVVTDKGEVYTLGSNEHGQLGISTYDSKYRPSKVPLEEGVIQIACGDLHTVALTYTGQVYVWGSNNYKQLGLIDYPNITRPQKLLSLPPISQIDAGAWNTFFLTYKDQLYRAGLMSTEIIKIPIEGVVKVSGGNHYALLIKN